MKVDNAASNERRYLDILRGRISTCTRYAPKFGQSGKGLSYDEFQDLYRGDRFYSWLGMNTPAVYAAHKTAGGLASLYRQIGSGCEEVFRTILQDVLGLSAADARWSFNATDMDGSSRTLKLDARVDLRDINDGNDRGRLREWVTGASAAIGVGPGVAEALNGVVFEIRQGYKSKDSKRQHADMVNAALAYTHEYLPCIVALSNQIDDYILRRYREKWVVLTGTNTGDRYTSTYDFMRDVVGYDLAGFFERNSAVLQSEVSRVVTALLGHGGPR